MNERMTKKARRLSGEGFCMELCTKKLEYAFLFCLILHMSGEMKYDTISDRMEAE